MRIVVATLLLAACETTPVVEGKVVDIWGQPIEGATVMVVGQNERPLTDGEGRYSIGRVEGEHEIKAGRKGYIQDHTEFEIKPGENASAPTFELYPKPEEPGFYAISTGEYKKLEHKLVHSVGTSLQSHRGIKSVGDTRVDSSRPRFIFHTELRHDEIMRLGLELHQLDFVRKADLKGPLSSTEVSVNLYVDKAKVPIDIKPMKSRTDYMVQPKEALEPGVYAFQTQDLLSTGDDDRFAEIPEELRVVFPFESR